ncbi:Mediator of RNA polymerase II transcription subunit 17 [Papilio machaon]|uniref:Mediator of RNA polymerase II transcription subunit 17 n=1 Tax=Papilio machaon TaxID=76193 RepID=A0A194RDP9_PAPMA|nr:Mediator of RNA polymerase II transcription subunit 17 [Papilio machaon]
MSQVTKAPEEQIAQAMSMNASGPAPSALRVTVPPELQGVAFISVLCQKEQEDVVTATLSSSALNCPGTLPGDGAELHWQQKLEAAQNVLFCKELFARLAAEAVQLDASIPHMVVGNQIMATVLPGIQLLIGLCHNNGQNNNNPDGIKSEGSSGKSEHDHVLEHSLHQLLRTVHHNNTHHPFPHPATGPLGPSKRRSLAGPMAADRYELLDMSKEQSLLEQIIQQAQHFFMRRRSEYVLDTIAKEVGDRMIAIRCEPSVGIQVYIAQSPRKDFFASELVQDKKWENLGGAFKEIKLEKMEGKNFLNKMELLMACLSSPS